MLGAPSLPWPISESLPASRGGPCRPGRRESGAWTSAPALSIPTLPCVPAAVSRFQHLQSRGRSIWNLVWTLVQPWCQEHKPVRAASCTWEGVPEKAKIAHREIPQTPCPTPRESLLHYFRSAGRSVSVSNSCPDIPGQPQELLRERQEMGF